MNKEKRITILSRLVKEGHIDLEEAFELMQPEEKIVYQPWVWHGELQPYTNPVSPWWGIDPFNQGIFCGESDYTTDLNGVSSAISCSNIEISDTLKHSTSVINQGYLSYTN